MNTEAAMQDVAGIIGREMENLKSQNSEQSFDAREWERRRVDAYNKNDGALTGIDCAECRNKGYIAVINDIGTMAMRECICAEMRRSIKRIERSGLKDLLDVCTFDTFKTETQWQKQAKGIALEFLGDCRGNWFFAGGQVGAGKTHLCTAIVGELLRQGRAARYMLWRDEIVPLKALVTESDAYINAISALKEIEILYIDDFLKTERDKPPTTADINIAFELLNYRYNSQELVTIISSERLIDDILEIDEAVGSRIYQRSKNYCLTVGYDQGKNYRLR